MGHIGDGPRAPTLCTALCMCTAGRGEIPLDAGASSSHGERSGPPSCSQRIRVRRKVEVGKEPPRQQDVHPLHLGLNGHTGMSFLGYTDLQQ